MAHVNAIVDQTERPLMTPDEILRLTPARKQGHGESEQIVAPGQMLIFVSGHYPILGTQMLYFFDPDLSKRAEIPPPTMFFALEKDQVVQQKPLERTPNVISQPELIQESLPVDPTTENPME